MHSTEKNKIDLTAKRHSLDIGLVNQLNKCWILNHKNEVKGKEIEYINVNGVSQFLN